MAVSWWRLWGGWVVSGLLSSMAYGQTLTERLEPIAAAHRGQIAIAVEGLVRSESFRLNEHAVLPTASLIKLPIMIETFRQAEAGQVDLNQKITLRAEDQVPGAGVLTDNFTPGAQYTLKDAVRLMITVSDNTATNQVLDAIRIPSTNATMAKFGFPETRIHSKVYRGGTTTIDPDRSKKYGLGSTTAHEMCGLLKLLVEEKVASPKSCQEMLAILRKNQDAELCVRLLPAGTAVAHKTGAVSAARTDAGIVYLQGKPAYIYVVLTSENQDQRWVIDNEAQLTLARVGRAIYDHFAPPEAAKPANAAKPSTHKPQP